MEQREVSDTTNVKWTCVQAYSGTNDQDAGEITKKTQRNGKVQVVCTPSGGAQSARIEVDTKWVEELSDDDLLGHIEQAKQAH